MEKEQGDEWCDPSLRKYAFNEHTSLGLPLLYNPLMNKRAKKRLKESIAKDKQERAKSSPQQRPGSSKDPQQQRGFLPRPDKKKG